MKYSGYVVNAGALEYMAPYQGKDQLTGCRGDGMSTGDDSTSRLLPHLIRLRDVPYYLGMDRNRFSAEVRPQLTEILIGEQGIAFDRLDLDAWVTEYKSRNGRPGQRRGDHLWDAKERRSDL